MNVLDLFSGACGGWSLGLERAGFHTVAAVEIDGWRRRQFAERAASVESGRTMKIIDTRDGRIVDLDEACADGNGPSEASEFPPLTPVEELYAAAREACTNGEWVSGDVNGWVISKEVYAMLQEACERCEQMTQQQSTNEEKPA